MTPGITQLQTKIKEGILKLDRRQYYQKFLIFFVLLKSILDSMCETMPDFIFMNPLFQCDGVLTPEQKACEIINRCKITNNFTATLHTKLYCQNEDFRSIIQSTYNFGVIVGMLTLVPFGDFGGKKLTILISIAIQAIGAFLSMLGIRNINWAVLIIGQLLQGIAYAGFDVASYVMMVQYLRDKLCQKALLLSCSALGISQMLYLPIYYLIPQWYNFLWYVILLPNVLFFVISAICLVQHPAFILFKKRDIIKFTKSIDHLAIYNQSDLGDLENLKQLGEKYIEYSELCLEQSSSHKKSCKQYLKKLYCHKRNLIPLICLILIYSGYNIYFSGMEDSMQRTGYNYGISMFIVGIQQFVCYLGFSFFANKFRRRKGLAISVLVTSLTGLSFLTNFVRQSLAIESIAISISTAFGVFSYSFFVLLQVESFPVDVMSTAQGTIESLGEISLLFVPYLVIRMNDIGIHPIVASSVFLLILGLTPIIFLRESLGTFKANEKAADKQQLQQSIAKQTEIETKQKQNLNL